MPRHPDVISLEPPRSPQEKAALGKGTRKVIQRRRKTRLADTLRKTGFAEGERTEGGLSQQALHLGLGESSFCPSLNYFTPPPLKGQEHDADPGIPGKNLHHKLDLCSFIFSLKTSVALARFLSWLERHHDTPRLQVGSQVRAHTRINQ